MIAFICSVVDDPNDQEYMIWLYETYKRLMFFTAKKFVSDPEICQDIVQDGLLKLIKKIPVIREKNRYILSDYIATTIRNTAINYLKRGAVEKKYVTRKVEEMDELEDTRSEQPSMEDLILAQEKSAYILDVLHLLSDNERILLEGKYILEYTDEELAEQLHCKPSSIRMKLTRARRKAVSLFRQIEQEGEGCDGAKADTRAI